MNINEYDVCAIGEMIIDCTPVGTSAGGTPMFEGNPGGAPCNVVACLSKLGKKTAYIGKVGKDAFGKYFIETIERLGIDTCGILCAEDLNTTLSFVDIDSNGDRSFRFYRDNTADVLLQKEEINYEIIDRSKIVHFGSVSMTHRVTREATINAVEYAKGKGKIISFDPNYRPNLWDDQDEAKACMKRGLVLADVVKMSEEELAFLADNSGDLKQKARKLQREFNISLLFVTLGSHGAYGLTEKGILWQPTFNVETVDTNGAGDAFTGGSLFYILETNKPLKLFDRKDIERCLVFANATGSMSTTKRGSIPAMPNLSDVTSCIQNAEVLDTMKHTDRN